MEEGVPRVGQERGLGGLAALKLLVEKYLNVLVKV